MVLQKPEDTINWCLRQDHFDLKRPNSAICRHRKTGISQKKVFYIIFYASITILNNQV